MNMRNKKPVSVALTLVLVLVALTWFAFFRDTSPKAVDSAEAAEARQQAIDEAVSSDANDPAVADVGTAEAAEGASDDDETSDGDTSDGDTNDGDTSDGDDTDDDAATDPGAPIVDNQGDSLASGAGLYEGDWRVDTSIGTFDDACLASACSSSFVGFRINEELAGIGAKTVVGRTPAVTGTIRVAGTQITEAEFLADMTQLITDDRSRNAALKGSAGGLETNDFPEASFLLTEPIELGELPAEGSAIDVLATGDLTVHGVTQPVTIPLTAESQAGLIIVFGNLEGLVLADFDIPKPSAVVVISVEDVAAMEFQLFFSR